MDIFTALAEPTRRSIIELLATGGELAASDIYNKFQVSQSAISQHLKVLLAAGLVRMRKRAQQRIYEINPESLQELELWARRLAETWNARYDALELLIEKQKASRA